MLLFCLLNGLYSVSKKKLYSIFIEAPGILHPNTPTADIFPHEKSRALKWIGTYYTRDFGALIKRHLLNMRLNFWTRVESLLSIPFEKMILMCVCTYFLGYMTQWLRTSMIGVPTKFVSRGLIPPTIIPSRLHLTKRQWCLTPNRIYRAPKIKPHITGSFWVVGFSLRNLHIIDIFPVHNMFYLTISWVQVLEYA